jgi:hypothetical protein
MHRIVVAVATLMLALPVPIVAAEDGAQRVIEYRKDALTLKVDKVPLTEVLAEIGRQSGAEVQGDVLQPRDLTLQLDKVPLKEALERLLADQNFTLTYADDGTLRAIHLKGGREAALGPDRLKPKPGVKYERFPGDEGETPPLWKAMYGAFADRGSVPVPPNSRLSKVVGGDKADWDLLVNTAFGSEDPLVRREAVQAAVKAFEENPDLEKSVADATSGASDADIAAFARATTYHRAEDLVRNIRNAAQDPALRERANAILRELAKIPYEGPKRREGGERPKPSEG